VTRYVGGPILRYGGKVGIADAIVPRLPRGKLYAELFFGAGGLFYAIPPGTYPSEVVNDLDHAIVNFFRVLRDRPQDLRAALEATPYAREEFRRALERSDDPLEEARRLWVRIRQSVNGVGLHWSRPSVGDGQPRIARTEGKLARLESFAARLRGVTIDCRDAIDLIGVYAGRDVAMYLDPPYLPSTRTRFGRGTYEHEMGEAGHLRLLEACVAAVTKGARIMLSGYPSPVYDEALSGWRKHEIATFMNATTTGPRQRRTEVLWMSYGPEHELARVAQLDLEVRT
jgi:DNA adenine methylase